MTMNALYGLKSSQHLWSFLSFRYFGSRARFSVSAFGTLLLRDFADSFTYCLIFFQVFLCEVSNENPDVSHRSVQNSKLIILANSTDIV